MSTIQSNSPVGSLTSAMRPTTFIESLRLIRRLGVRVTLATETFQHTGSFKFRAAWNVASTVHQQLLITASSGNFGQALAYACQLLGKSAIIVMPSTSARIKIDAVESYGARVEIIDTNRVTRTERVSQLREQHPEAYIASAYDDPLAIAGNSSLGRELRGHGFDTVVVPVGGGGLISGIVQGLSENADLVPPASGLRPKVVGAEPMLANDAAQSLKCGHLVRNQSEPQTIADGARTLSLGQHNWEIIRDGVSTIVEVPEGMITKAVQVLFLDANLKVEPTGALAVAALLTQPELFRDQRSCCVISGGNVDPIVYASILQS